MEVLQQRLVPGIDYGFINKILNKTNPYFDESNLKSQISGSERENSNDYVTDAKTFAEWGIDLIKVGACGEDKKIWTISTPNWEKHSMNQVFIIIIKKQMNIRNYSTNII